jgi:hypothetical protein
MTTSDRFGEPHSCGHESPRRRFLNRLALLAGGVLFAPLFARAASVSAFGAVPSARKRGQAVVFPGAHAAALTHRLDRLGFASAHVLDQDHAHAVASKQARESGGIAVIGAGAGIAGALRFARSHAAVRAVIVMGEDHGDALEEFRALQASRPYAVHVLGAIDGIDWDDAGRWLDRHLA